METLKYGLMLTLVPFSLIFIFTAIWWALTDLAVRKVSGVRRLLWTLLVLLVPPFGTILYGMIRRRGEHQAASI